MILVCILQLKALEKRQWCYQLAPKYVGRNVQNHPLSTSKRTPLFSLSSYVYWMCRSRAFTELSWAFNLSQKGNSLLHTLYSRIMLMHSSSRPPHTLLSRCDVCLCSNLLEFPPHAIQSRQGNDELLNWWYFYLWTVYITNFIIILFLIYFLILHVTKIMKNKKSVL